MLKTLIGDAAFYKGMSLYFDRHDGQAVTIEDFYACFEEASGQDLSDFRRWYSQPGTPHVSFTETFDPDAEAYSVRFTQTPGKSGAENLPIPVTLSVFDHDGIYSFEDMVVLENEDTKWSRSAKRAPLLSVNRGFSAPIRIEDQRSNETRLRLALMENDPFNKWDTFQSLLKSNLISAAYDDASIDIPLIEALASAIMVNASPDPAYACICRSARAPAGCG